MRLGVLQKNSPFESSLVLSFKKEQKNIKLNTNYPLDFLSS